MQQAAQILKLAQQLGYLPTSEEIPDNSDTEETVVLTDEETQVALKAARENKLRQIKSKAYWDKVKKVTTIPTLTAQQYLDLVILRAEREIPNFLIREHQKPIFVLLAQYFTQDIEFAKSGYSLQKGLYLFGGVGCGKTTIMRLFNHNPLHSYAVIPTSSIASQYVKDGDVAIYRYASEYDATMVENPFQCTSWGICFDDLGVEMNKKHFGNEMNVMESVLRMRYDNHAQIRNRTHVTTNLTADELEEQYGTRIRSRMREMFNIIDVSGDDLRK